MKLSAAKPWSERTVKEANMLTVSRLLLATLLSVVAVLALTQGLSAAPGPSTTVVLACDHNVNGAVTFTLQPSLFDTTNLGGGSLDCGPDSISGLKRNSVKISTTQDAGWINVSSFTVSTFSGGCLGGSTIPAKMECPLDGSRGATLTAR
jgi:hypothetical protein